MTARPLRLAAATALWPLLAAFAPQEAPDLTAEFDAVCVASRGDPDRVEAAALARGFTAATPEPDEATPAAGADPDKPAPRAWSRRQGEAEVRVVAAPDRMRIARLWIPVDRCYVSGPGRFREARAALIAQTGIDPFRRGDTAVFAWLGEADRRAPLSQTRFERNFEPLLREDGMQMILVSETAGEVTLSFTTARPPAE